MDHLQVFMVVHPIRSSNSRCVRPVPNIAEIPISAATQVFTVRDTAAHHKVLSIAVPDIANPASNAPETGAACLQAIPNVEITPALQAITAAAATIVWQTAPPIAATGPLVRPATSARGTASTVWLRIQSIVAIISVAAARNADQETLAWRRAK